MVGGNFRLDAVQAACLSVKLPHLPEYTAARMRNACEYTRSLAPLRDAGLTLPAIHADRTHIANQYTIRVPGRRDALRSFLAERDIATAIYYPVPLHAQECFRQFGPYPSLPVSESLASEVLSLPVFPELSSEEQAAVVSGVRNCFGRS
jgi:dTDP-4-amino-4,6-dideoxygalactose transaminase